MDSETNMSSIAKALGMHPSTVSRALRDDRRLPEKTRVRVREMADSLGYKPNPLVSALMARRRKSTPDTFGSTLALLTFGRTVDEWRLNSVQYTATFEAMQRHATDRGYRTEEVHLNAPDMPPRRLKEILLYRGIRGLVICPLPQKAQRLNFDFSDFAAIAMGQTLQNPSLDHVTYDYGAAMKEILSRLLADNFQRIGFLSPSLVSDRVDNLSLGAFLAEKHRNPRRLLTPPVWSENFDKENILNWIKAQRPDVIITPTQRVCNLLESWINASKADLKAAIPLLCADCHLDTNSNGMLRNTDAEASAIIELLTHRVERGRFGVPSQMQTILVSGQWRTSSQLAMASTATP